MTRLRGSADPRAYLTREAASVGPTPRTPLTVDPPLQCLCPPPTRGGPGVFLVGGGSGHHRRLSAIHPASYRFAPKLLLAHRRRHLRRGPRVPARPRVVRRLRRRGSRRRLRPDPQAPALPAAR